ncbi:MAG: transglycosylase domain-containing protein [Gaiellaceae bacterium]
MSPKRRSEPKPKPRPKPRRRRRVLAVLAVVMPLALLALTAAGGAVYFGASCDLGSLRPVRQADSSLVYGANGSLVGVLPAVENRTAVAHDAIGPWMPRATVAIEDRRFYEHGGVDPVGILRALVADVSAGRIVQGGSTITQELVRNLYLTREQTLRRKVVEACLAVKLARTWPKDRILTAYLNDVYYGNHAYGIQAAAETYFSVPAASLTLEQAALLAGLPQAPSYYDPLHNPSAALARRDEVLRALRRSGEITAARYAAAVRDRSLHLRPSPAYASREPYFVGYVESLLDQAYGAATVRAGGLRIYTTIQPRLQRAAVRALSKVVYAPRDPAGAIVSIDPATGAVRAMAAVTPGASGLGLVTAAERQPGSTFKPIVLAAAVAEGMNPWATRYLSAPFYYAPLDWHVRTYDGTYAGPESVAAATLHSDNTVYARLALDVGPEAIAGMAEKLGVRTGLQATPALALGADAVTPLDMASAYATLAAGGVYARPLAIRRVAFPGGKVDSSWAGPERERVVPDWVAATVTHVLEENMLHGTGVGAHVPGRADAGKTGTTDDYADAWFCGYTPSLEATVWIGYPQAEIPMLDVHGAAVSGPTLPATAWRLFMGSALEGTPSLAFASAVSAAEFAPWDGRYAYRAASPPVTSP